MKISHNNAQTLGTAATLHAALAIPNVTMMEAPFVNSNRRTKVAGPYPEVVDGYALPLEPPGLGVTIDEDAAAEMPFNNDRMQLNIQYRISKR